MDSPLFLVLWIVIIFFVARFIGRRYLPDPRRGDVAAAGTAAIFAVAAVWYHVAHTGSTGSSSAVQPAAGRGEATAGAVAAQAPAIKDTTAACRSITGPFPATPHGSIDLVRPASQAPGSAVIADGGQLDRRVRYFVEGWAAQANMEGAASGVCLVVDGKVDARDKVSYGLRRSDVAAGFHNDLLVGSGYRIEIAPGSMAPGKHHIQVVSLSGARALGVVPAERHLTVY